MNEDIKIKKENLITHKVGNISKDIYNESPNICLSFYIFCIKFLFL